MPTRTQGTASSGSPEYDLIRQLDSPACYDHSVESIRHIETHISHILLTGTFAYKIKKALNLGFLDFSTLDKRLVACQEEVRLNQRLAPETYLGVVPITGTFEAPEVNGLGAPIEYAVKMRQFPPDATLDRLDADNQLTRTHIEAVGRILARFHETDCARADSHSTWGAPEQIRQPVAQNFLQISPLLIDPDAQTQLDELQQWSEAEHRRLIPLMIERKCTGFVRECHGDLHLGNLAWVNERLLVFDCLEFDPALRWIDVQSDVAFCTMDLMQRGHMDLAWLLLNTWLEVSGDYAGLALLRYYAVYRALVRAKIAAVRASQTLGTEQTRARADTLALLALATRLTIHPWPLRLDITHGLSGSGKTTISRALMQTPGAIRLRSDVERKRLAGLEALSASGSKTGQGLYTDEVTRRIYSHLARQAGTLLEAGWPVIVDATFIARWQRDMFRELARAHGVPFHILNFEVAEATLRDRVRQRGKRGRDASEADLDVLQYQIETAEPLGPDELDHATPIHAGLHMRT
ncbi:MAG: AAA family ATPase [Thiobacillus sp.]|nr:AAA family ATPase [Thiobacillus sp.]